ncbi:DUF3348 domain-containing protein, partial [Burkholderia multivorans]
MLCRAMHSAAFARRCWRSELDRRRFSFPPCRSRRDTASRPWRVRAARDARRLDLAAPYLVRRAR